VTQLGEVAALGTAICWTITSSSFQSAGRRVGSLPVNLIRLVLALLPLSLYTWVVRGAALPLDASGATWGWLALSGVIGFSIGDLFLFQGFVLVGARISMLIMMSLTPPVAAVIGLLFLGEHLSALDWLAMAITIAGVAWVVLERQPNDTDRSRSERRKGIFLGLGATLGQAIGLILSKHGMGDYDPFAATQIRILAGVAGFVLLFFPLRAWPRVRAALTNRPAMARTSLGAFFGPFLGVSLSLVAIQNTATGVAATIFSLVPVLLIIPAVVLFKERVTLRAVLGACVAVGGVALLFLQ